MLRALRPQRNPAASVALALALGATALACGGDDAAEAGEDDVVAEDPHGTSGPRAAPTPPASTDGEDEPEAAEPSGPRCDPKKPFGKPVRVPGLTGHHATFTADELTAFFSYNRRELFMATRPSRDAAFGAPKNLTTLNTLASEDNPSVSADGLTIYFDRDGQEGGIFKATRESTDDAFGRPERFLASTTEVVRWAPFVSADGETVLFSREGSGSASVDLWWKRGDAAERAIAGVNGPKIDRTPVLSADGLTLVFGSDRDGTNPTEYGIWIAKRKSTSEAFGKPTKLSELGPLVGWMPSWLSPDGCALYLNFFMYATPETSVALRPL